MAGLCARLTVCLSRRRACRRRRTLPPCTPKQDPLVSSSPLASSSTSPLSLLPRFTRTLSISILSTFSHYLTTKTSPESSPELDAGELHHPTLSSSSKHQGIASPSFFFLPPLITFKLKPKTSEASPRTSLLKPSALTGVPLDAGEPSLSPIYSHFPRVGSVGALGVESPLMG